MVYATIPRFWTLPYMYLTSYSQAEKLDFHQTKSEIDIDVPPTVLVRHESQSLMQQSLSSFQKVHLYKSFPSYNPLTIYTHDGASETGIAVITDTCTGMYKDSKALLVKHRMKL